MFIDIVRMKNVPPPLSFLWFWSLLFLWGSHTGWLAQQALRWQEACWLLDCCSWNWLCPGKQQRKYQVFYLVRVIFSWCDTETFVMLTVSVMNVQINFQTSKVVQNDLQKHTCFKPSLSIFISSAGWMRPPVNTQPIGTAHFTQITKNSAVSLLLQVPVTVLTQHQQEETHQRQHQQKDGWKFTSYRSVIQIPFAGVLYICMYMSSVRKVWLGFI